MAVAAGVVLVLLLFVLALDVQSEAADDAAAEKVEMQAMLVTAGITLCGPWANAFVCTAPNHFIALDEQKISAGFLTSCPSFSGRLSNHHEASVRQKTITVASCVLCSEIDELDRRPAIIEQ